MEIIIIDKVVRLPEFLGCCWIFSRLFFVNASTMYFVPMKECEEVSEKFFSFFRSRNKQPHIYFMKLI